MEQTAIKTKRGVTKEALRTLMRLKRQEELPALRGKLHSPDVL